MPQKNSSDNMRSLLKSEITWLVFVVITMMGIVTTIVMPLQKVQLELSNIALQLGEDKIIYERIEARLNKVELDHAKIMGRN